MSSPADPTLVERPVPDLLASIWRYRLMVLALAVLGALAGGAVRVAFPGLPTATVSVTLRTVGSHLTEATPLTPADQATFVANQMTLFRDSRVLSRVSGALGPRYSPSNLAPKIHVHARPTGTTVIVEVTDHNPATAVRIAKVLVFSYRVVARQQTEIAAYAAIKEITAAQTQVAGKLAAAFRQGTSGKGAANAEAAALAALTVQLAQVRINEATYGDGIASWQDATRTHGGKRVPGRRLALIGLAIGLLVGVLAAWIRADRHRQVSTGAEAARLLGSELLAEIPAVLGGIPAPFDALHVAEQGDRRRLFGRAPHQEDGSDGSMATADPYFALASALASKVPSKLIAVTGVDDGSGATTTAIGLAMSATRDGSNVLLVDADPHTRALAEAAHIEPDRPGLYEVAAGSLGVPDVIVRCAVGEGSSIDVLPSGAGSDRYPYVLRSAFGRSIFDALAARYDLVVVDTGPLLRTASTVALVPFVGAVVTVIRHGTDVEAAAAVREQLALLQARHAGSVFTFSRSVEAMQS